MTTIDDQRLPPDHQRLVVTDGRVTRDWLGWFGWVARRCRGIVVYATLDPVSIPAGGRQAYAVTVTGANPGQWAIATHSTVTENVMLLAAVTAQDIVTVTFWNATGVATVDLPSGTIRVRVGDMT